MKFFKLFEPLEIGNMTISNRIVMPAINLNMANDGYITQQLIDFYVERAKGGAGMLIVGGCYVDLYGKGVPMMISIDNDDFLLLGVHFFYKDVVDHVYEVPVLEVFIFVQQFLKSNNINLIVYVIKITHHAFAKVPVFNSLFSLTFHFIL